MQAMSVNLC